MYRKLEKQEKVYAQKGEIKHLTPIIKTSWQVQRFSTLVLYWSEKTAKGFEDVKLGWLHERVGLGVLSPFQKTERKKLLQSSM